jgi:hypothetical protein
MSGPALFLDRVPLAYSHAIDLLTLGVSHENCPADGFLILDCKIEGHASAQSHRINQSRAFHTVVILNGGTIGFNYDEEVSHGLPSRIG